MIRIYIGTKKNFILLMRWYFLLLQRDRTGWTHRIVLTVAPGLVEQSRKVSAFKVNLKSDNVYSVAERQSNVGPQTAVSSVDGNQTSRCQWKPHGDWFTVGASQQTTCSTPTPWSRGNLLPTQNTGNLLLQLYRRETTTQCYMLNNCRNQQWALEKIICRENILYIYDDKQIQRN